MRQLCAVLTCHNRRALTVACLDRFFASQVDGLALSAVVVDDGCTDGTGDEVTLRFGARVILVRGNGQLFWNGGMRVAMASAMATDPDFILWLNDDSMIQPDTVAVMLRTHDERIRLGDSTAIVVAAFADPVSGDLTYSGIRQVGPRLRPLVFRQIAPSDQPLRCETVNGNCLLVPRLAWQKLQNLEPRFVHALGDYDYGLRATAMAIPIWLAPGILGLCSRNSDRGTFMDPELPLAQRWRAITATRGFPMRPWAVYVKRHGGVLWPLYWASPYLRVLFAGIAKKRVAR